MSYKPDQTTLIAYLYGELSAEEQEQLNNYLSGHPELQTELSELKNTRKLLGKLENEVVVEPRFVADQKNIVLPGKLWQSNAVKWPLAIAASIAIVILAGFLAKLKIGISSSGMQLTFGQPQYIEQSHSANVTKADVSAWVKEAMATHNVSLETKLNGLEEHVLQTALSQKAVNNKVSQLTLQQSVNGNALVGKYIKQLKSENETRLLRLLEDAQHTQKVYVDEIITDFSNYLEEQRQQDLELIRTGYNQLRNNTELNQLETNEVLASLITTVKNQNN